jgi:hypothetical protein
MPVQATVKRHLNMVKLPNEFGRIGLWKDFLDEYDLQGVLI